MLRRWLVPAAWPSSVAAATVAYRVFIDRRLSLVSLLPVAVMLVLLLGLVGLWLVLGKAALDSSEDEAFHRRVAITLGGGVVVTFGIDLWFTEARVGIMSAVATAGAIGYTAITGRNLVRQLLRARRMAGRQW